MARNKSSKNSNAGSNKRRWKLSDVVIVALISAFATVLVAVITIVPQLRKDAPLIITQTPFVAPVSDTAIFIQSPISTTTDTPQPSLMSADSFTSTPLPIELIDAQGVVMRLVLAGEFTMGSNNGNSNEEPVHQVYLDTYYIDKYEVSNFHYKACVNANKCTPPYYTNSKTRDRYYSDSAFDNYPVVFVDWYMAKSYCEWRGAQLPSEAQWEKAARGENGQMYPWGNTFDGTRVNFCDKNCPEGIADMNFDDGYVDTSPTGSYENGKSPYGVYDLAGNVWEWVADWYSERYYENSSLSNPLGPELGEDRVLRGGAANYYFSFTRSSARYSHKPVNSYSYVGFRCAMNPNP